MQIHNIRKYLRLSVHLFGGHITFQCFLCHYILLLEGALSLYVSLTSSRNSYICVYMKTGVETSKKRQYKKHRDM